MISVRIIVLMLGLLTPSSALLSAQSLRETGRDVVRRLYADLACEAVRAEPRCPTDRALVELSRERLSRYFDRRLADLWDRDRACTARTRDVCRLDFSPIWDSQDPAGTTVRILPTDREERVEVELRHSGAPDVVRLQFEVVQRASGWRIRDIVKPGVWSLTQMLSTKP